MLEEIHLRTIHIADPCSWRLHSHRVDWSIDTMIVPSPISEYEVPPLPLWSTAEYGRVPEHLVTRSQQIHMDALLTELKGLGHKVLSMGIVVDAALASIDASLSRLHGTQEEIEEIKRGLRVG